MAFENVGYILRAGSIFSSFKLLLAAASSSRPSLRPLCLLLLRPFVRQGQIAFSYRCYGRTMRGFLRLSDLSNDLYSVFELSIRDSYHLSRSFKPDLVIDGGANIGLFTLRVAAAAAADGASPVRFVACEPLPRNVEQLRRHLAANRIQAEVMEGCLGGSRRSVPFYCREALSSSFDPQQPYTRVLEMPVYTLQDAIGDSTASRILIKLDIEGMEVEVLKSFIPTEGRAVYLVGELHECAANRREFEQIFRDHGWILELGEVAYDDHALFRACSPAALPELGWNHAAEPLSTLNLAVDN